MSFDSLGLKPELLSAITKLGFQNPTPIQEQAIPKLLQAENDFVGLAGTGTGKTCAFGLPLLQRIQPGRRKPQGLILCPTRELCLQIATDLSEFGVDLPNIETVAVYGGANIVAQMRQLNKGADIIVATPGRLLDLMRRKSADLSEITTVVLDEADEMLNMGFQEDIDSIFEEVTENARVWLFSATMAKGVARIAANYLTNPEEVTVGGKNEGNKNVSHSSYMVHEKHRYQALKRLLDCAPDIYGLVFCRTRKETQDVAEALLQDGYNAEALHGDLSQVQRDHVMRKFRQRAIQVLVATDVAARGIDVDDITHVIHYRLPDEFAVYNHRSGRTGRAGKTGHSQAIINMKESSRIRDIGRVLKLKIEPGKIPDGNAICEKQLFHLVDKVKQTEVNIDEIGGYLESVYEQLKDFNKEEVIQRFVSAEFNRFIEYYRHAADINVEDRPRRERGERGERGDRGERRGRGDYEDREPRRERGARPLETGMKRLFIGAGRLDQIKPGALVRLVCDSANIPSNAIGEIKMNREFSFVDVDESVFPGVLKAMQNAKLDGNPVNVREANSKEGDFEGSRGPGRSGRKSSDRGDRGDRPARSDRSDRGGRSDRGDRGDRSERSDRSSSRGGSRPPRKDGKGGSTHRKGGSSRRPRD